VLSVVIWSFSRSAEAQSVVIIDVLSQSGGILEEMPSFSSSILSYQRCTSFNMERQALLKMNVIGTGANQIPLGSTVSSASLRLRASMGGDGLLYRAAEPWDSTPTWNEVGDVATIGPSIGVGLNMNQSQEFDVTSHVQAWANGTTNQGWVIKGFLDDCMAAQIYGGTSASNNRPRLTVVYTPPDTTPPTVDVVMLGSTLSTHADYIVPSGSGEQLRTVPVARINRIYVMFSENVTNVNSGAFSLVSSNTGTSYSLATNGVSYSPSTFIATFTLANSIVNPDQLVLTIKGTVEDLAGNELDGEWANPTSLASTGSDTFPSGNGSPGPAGGFQFYVSVLPGDYNRNNATDAADYTVWRDHEGIETGAGQADGDGDGDGDVDSDDYQIWTSQFGVDFSTW
jgi:hypothetical protein